MNLSNDNRFNGVFEAATSTGQQLATAAAKSGDCLPAALCLSLAPALGALSVTAVAVMPRECEKPNQDHFIFAACLAICSNTILDNGTSCFSFGPDVLGDSLDMFTKLTGKQPDNIILSAIIEAARSCAESGAVPLNRLLLERAVSGSKLQ